MKSRSIICAASLAVMAAFGALAVDVTPAAAAWTAKQLAAQERYNACKARLQMDPPCNDRWRRQCARRCGSRY